MNYRKIEQLLQKRRNLENSVSDIHEIEEPDQNLSVFRYGLMLYTGPLSESGRNIGYLEREEILEIVSKFKIKYLAEIEKIEKELKDETGISYTKR